MHIDRLKDPRIVFGHKVLAAFKQKANLSTLLQDKQQNPFIDNMADFVLFFIREQFLILSSPLLLFMCTFLNF